MSDPLIPPENAAEAANLPVLTVSEISGAIRRTMEDAFGLVRVRGEVSRARLYGSGHLYLTIKDENAVLEGVCWRTKVAALTTTPEEGMEVIVTGRITTYAARSQYQLLVENVELAGEGALLKLIEDRRKRLAAEGLFDEERKRELPFLPDVIGVVTSPQGAVIRDILHRLGERFPRHVLIWPAVVQGKEAAAQVAAGINGFNALTPGGAIPRPDLIIVARGGGGLDDLMAFNEEIVVRAAAESEIPLISAVGHETDHTLIDFAADLRAPTPTAAAEKAVPVRREIAAGLRDQAGRLESAAMRLIDDRRGHLAQLWRIAGDPGRLVLEAAQRFDERAERLRIAGSGILNVAMGRLAEAAAGLRPIVLQSTITHGADKLAGLGQGIGREVARRLADSQTRFERAAALLESYSYQGVLARGFAVVRDATGAPIAAAEATKPGMDVAIEFADGEVPAVIGGTGRKSAARRRAAPVAKDDGPQGTLL